MKPISVFGLFLFLGAIPVPASGTNYDNVIVHPEAPGKKILAPAIEDGVAILERMTGEDFRSETGGADARGIVLALSGDGHLPPQVAGSLQSVAGEKEPFVLFSDSPERLLIAANDPRGLAHGLYTYLWKLGCRWYLPGENWEMIPSRDDITLHIDELVVPDFRSRQFFGTGSFGIRTPVDPDRAARNNYGQWKRRNRWGGEFRAGGHFWEKFVAENEEIFREHPEFRAMHDGERVALYDSEGKLRKHVKFCVSNPELIRLFAEDRAQLFRDRPHYPVAPIEPSDGAGFCECENCLAIGNGSVSDRVFYFANEVAKIVGEEFPDKTLGHLAYNKHAGVPSFDLEPNLYVQVVPTAFQSTRYSPVELLKTWGKKMNGRNLGTYDYWIIPDWDRDMPAFDFMRKPGETIRMWKQAGLDSFNIETTFGGGPMGLALYLTSQLAWDTDFAEGDAIEEFYHRSFGAAAAPMKRMLERWAEGYHPLPTMLGAAFLDMREALDLAADEPEDVRRRILDFANYLQFVRLYQEYRALPRGDSIREEKARAAIKLLWRTYYSHMVHVFRVQWMIRLRDEKDTEWIQEFDMRSPEEKGWQEVLAEGPVTEEETLAAITRGVADYGDKAGEIRRFDGPLVPLRSDVARPDSYFPRVAFQTYGYTRFTFVVPEGVPELRIRIRALIDPTPKRPPIRVRFFDNTELAGGALVETELADTGEREIVLPTERPGRYELLTLSMARSPFEIHLPEVPMAITKLTPYGPFSRRDARYWFYVPAGVENVVVKSGRPPGGDYQVRIEDEAGNPIPYESVPAGGKRYYVASNPDPEQPRIWQLVDFRNRGLIELIGVPQALGLSKDTLLVPEGLQDTPPAAEFSSKND